MKDPLSSPYSPKGPTGNWTNEPPSSVELVKRLIEIANADYAEPDPRTGEAYELNGRIIVAAAAKIEELEQRIKELEQIAECYESDLAGEGW